MPTPKWMYILMLNKNKSVWPAIRICFGNNIAVDPMLTLFANLSS